MKNFLKKIILFLIAVFIFNFFSVKESFAYYSDNEKSEQNVLSVGVLDFTANSLEEFTPPILSPGDFAKKEIIIARKDSMDFQYNISAIKVFGDEDFCNSLKLEAKLEGTVKYSGSLMGLNFANPIVIGGDGKDNWLFTITLASDALPSFQNKSCQFKFIFNAWQANLQDSSSGFFDKEEVLNNIQSGDWLPKIVINEVYYNPDDEHGGANAEWIELYNAGDSVVNLKNWYFKNDSNSVEKINQTYNIEPGQFAVVAANASVWNTYWDLTPTNALKIALGGCKLFYGLKDDGDYVALFNNKDIEIDAMSWQGNTYAFNPSCQNVEKGHSLARSPKGYDTDSMSDFVDLAVPNPGTNPHSVVLKNDKPLCEEKKPDEPEEIGLEKEDAPDKALKDDDQDKNNSSGKEEDVLEKDNSEEEQEGKEEDGDNDGNDVKPVDGLQSPK